MPVLDMTPRVFIFLVLYIMSSQLTSGIKALKEAGRPLRSLLWLNGTMRTWQGLTRSINFLEVTIIHTYPKVVTGNYLQQ